jgi:hypothetical protein
MAVIFLPRTKPFDLNKLPDLIHRFCKLLYSGAKQVQGVYEASKIRRLGDDLMSLAFWHDGMLEQINALAQNSKDPIALEQLAQKLKGSESDVAEAIERLKRARNSWVPRVFSPKIAGRIDRLIKLKVGSGYIRSQLLAIVQRRERVTAAKANHLERQVKEFMSELFALHDALLEKTKARKVAAERKSVQPSRTSKRTVRTN